MEEEIDSQPPETPLAGEVTQGTAFQGVCHKVPFPLSLISAPPCGSSPWTVVTQALETLQKDGVPVPAELSSAQTGSAPHCAVQANVTVTVSTAGTCREVREQNTSLPLTQSVVFFLLQPPSPTSRFFLAMMSTLLPGDKPLSDPRPSVPLVSRFKPPPPRAVVLPSSFGDIDLG